jgi:ABC-type thiamine transport system ATPase subunit
MILVAHRPAAGSTEGEPWRSIVVILSAFIALVFGGGWAIAGAWLIPTLAVGVAVWSFPKTAGWRRPDAIDIAAGAAAAAAFAMRPELLIKTGGGWVAPIILILGVRRLVRVVPALAVRMTTSEVLRPPARDVRGTVSFSGSVAGSDGLPRTVPLDLEIRAGTSLAILCDDGTESRDLAEALAGRRPPVEGQFCIDGIPPAIDDGLVAFVGLGEPFIIGDLGKNVAELCDAPLDPDQLAAVQEACGLSDVEEKLQGGPLLEDGRPLDPHHRLMVQLARVLVSHYRILVVLDPMVSVNPVRSEMWKAALVRASVGRTAVWVTPDRDLAERAEQVMVLRHGTLRPFVFEEGGD